MNTSYRQQQLMENTAETTPRDVAARWTERLGSQFCPVSSYFLSNYSRLRPHSSADGLNSAQAMLVIQLMDFKWDRRPPHPSTAELARRLGVTQRSVRDNLRTLEGLGLLKEANASGLDSLPSKAQLTSPLMPFLTDGPCSNGWNTPPRRSTCGWRGNWVLTNGATPQEGQLLPI